MVSHCIDRNQGPFQSSPVASHEVSNGPRIQMLQTYALMVISLQQFIEHMSLCSWMVAPDTVAWYETSWTVFSFNSDGFSYLCSCSCDSTHTYLITNTSTAQLSLGSVSCHQPKAPKISEVSQIHQMALVSRACGKHRTVFLQPDPWSYNDSNSVAAEQICLLHWSRSPSNPPTYHLLPIFKPSYNFPFWIHVGKEHDYTAWNSLHRVRVSLFLKSILWKWILTWSLLGEKDDFQFGSIGHARETSNARGRTWYISTAYKGEVKWCLGSHNIKTKRILKRPSLYFL